MKTGTNLKPERSHKLGQLLPIKTLSGLATPAAFDHVAQLIDLSFDLNNLPGLEQAIALVPELVARDLKPEEQALLHYFVANAWANTRHLKRKGQASQWEWEQVEFEKEIISLRSALRSEGFKSLDAVRQCQVLTNLGNALNHIGRSVEAIEYWDRALLIRPKFGMAWGNRGHGLVYYASLFEHLCHQVPFLKKAHHDLKTALTLPLERGASEVFKAAIVGIQERASIERLEEPEPDQDDNTLGTTSEEVNYRHWCLRERLFLNTLNDLGPKPAAARDNLTAPSIVVSIKDEIPFFAFFNQIKQEFVSARFLYFEGITSSGAHYSDRDVLLYNTFDYPTYSLAIERVKSAFRILYSLFDKIAFFLNQYLELAIPERQVTFRTFWYVSQDRKKGPRPELHQRRNWPLRGLFWLSKDLCEDKSGFHEAIEPDAQELATLRNHLEHKYLRVHEYRLPPHLRLNQLLSPPTDSFSHSIGRRDFEAKTLRLLKTLRAALIYLSLAIYTEERFRSQERDPNQTIPVLPAHLLKDDFKV